MLALGYRHRFAPERLLMGGIAIGTAMSALTAVLMSTGDPRLAGLLTWLAGSTYAVTTAEAGLGCGMAVVLLAVTVLTTRWLDILPLGEPTARALGVPIGPTRLILLLLAAAQTAGATLIVGPLSFVGLLAPHAARMLGLRRAWPALLGATLLGMLVMAMSDWLGRNLLFPYQIPAGLVASLVGGPYLMLLLLAVKYRYRFISSSSKEFRFDFVRLAGVLMARRHEQDGWKNVRLIMAVRCCCCGSRGPACAADQPAIRHGAQPAGGVDAGCRVYLVVGNDGAKALESLKLDLVLFNSDGVIDRRLALEAGPLRTGQDQRQAVRPHRPAVQGTGQHPRQRCPGLPRGRRCRAGLLFQAGPGDADAGRLHQIARRDRVGSCSSRRRAHGRCDRSALDRGDGPFPVPTDMSPLALFLGADPVGARGDGRCSRWPRSPAGRF